MRLVVGGLIALTLLFLYVYAVVRAIALAWAPAGGQLNTGELLALTTIGGLVSALVIAKLAITPAGAPLTLETSRSDTLSQAASQAAPWVIGLYVIIWAAVGVTAFVIGVMQYPGKVQSLTDLGQSWLGLAVASAYAYFGINRDG